MTEVVDIKELIRTATSMDMFRVVTKGLMSHEADIIAQWMMESPLRLMQLVGWSTTKDTTDNSAKGILTLEVSCLFLRIGRAMAKAEAVFDGDTEKAVRWMKSSSLALGGRMPMECLSNEFGSEAVMQLLTRMEQGIYS